MARTKEVTPSEIEAFLERMTNLSFEASDLADRLGKSFGVDLAKPAALASEATNGARRFLDLAAKLNTVSRQDADRADLKRNLQEQLRADA